MHAILRKKHLILLALALATSFTAACGDDPVVEEDPADAIVKMNLLVGTQGIMVTAESGVVAGGPIVIGAGTTAFAASFVDAAGATVTGLDEFEVRVTPVNTAVVTYTSTGKFTGTLTRIAPGTTQLKVGLWHLAEGHFDVGEFSVGITVN